MRYLFIIFLLLIMSLRVNAEIFANTIYAVTTVNLNTKNIKNNKTIDLIILEKGTFSSDLSLKEGEKINIKITDYVKPKRGKRDGYYKIEYIISRDKIMKGRMRASTPKDFHNLAQKTGITIAGYILKIPGFSQAVAVSKGIANPNRNETRLQSAGKNLYESTPLAYIETGKDFEVEQDGIVVLKLKEKQ